MSAQSLLSEVQPALSVHHVIKSADQVYYKDQQVYTKPVTQCTAHAGGSHKKDNHHHHNNKKHHNRGGRHGHEAGGNGGHGKLQESIAAVKSQAESALGGGGGSSGSSAGLSALQKEVANLQVDNKELHKQIDELRQLIQKLCTSGGSASTCTSSAAVPTATSTAPAPAKKADEGAGDDDDFELFGSDDDEEESEEQKRVREERLAAYAAKKAKKPGPIAKSSVLLDVKPWEDTTNMEELEQLVRNITMDGLNWGAGKLVPLAYGVRKLQIICTVEDEKVSVDDLIEKIQEFEDHVQSVDVAAFNKI